MSSLKPIKIWGKHSPNPPKIAMICEELGIPYDADDTQLADIKSPEFLAINPNGRMPVIRDANTGWNCILLKNIKADHVVIPVTIWESGAIIEYLIEKYDTAQKLSFPDGSEESYIAKQWLFFQVSGQGPYYGQAVWFTIHHAEQIQSAQERYYNEIKRVTSVLEGHLKQQEKGEDGPWLVGNKFSYADLVFVSWQNITMNLLSEKVDLTEYTETAGWIERMKARPGIAKVLAEPAH